MNKCPQCDGKGEMRVTVSTFGEEGETSFVTSCPTCNGAKEISDDLLRAFTDFKESWCKCDTLLEHRGSTYFADGTHPDVHKHHWRCDRCKGITQIG